MVRPAPPFVAVLILTLLLPAASTASASTINVLVESDNAQCLVISEWPLGQLPASRIVCIDNEDDRDEPLTNPGSSWFAGSVAWMTAAFARPTAAGPTVTPTITLSASTTTPGGGGNLVPLFTAPTFTSPPITFDIPTGLPLPPDSSGQPLPAFSIASPASSSEESLANPPSLTIDSVVPITPVPEPATLLMFGTGLLLAWRTIQR